MKLLNTPIQIHLRRCYMLMSNDFLSPELLVHHLVDERDYYKEHVSINLDILYIYRPSYFSRNGKTMLDMTGVNIELSTRQQEILDMKILTAVVANAMNDLYTISELANKIADIILDITEYEIVPDQEVVEWYESVIRSVVVTIVSSYHIGYVDLRECIHHLDRVDKFYVCTSIGVYLDQDHTSITTDIKTFRRKK